MRRRRLPTASGRPARYRFRVDTTISNATWRARFVAALLLLRPGLSGLEAAQIAERIFDASEYLDPEDAAAIYARGLVAAEMHCNPSAPQR